MLAICLFYSNDRLCKDAPEFDRSGLVTSSETDNLKHWLTAITVVVVIVVITVIGIVVFIVWKEYKKKMDRRKQQQNGVITVKGNENDHLLEDVATKTEDSDQGSVHDDASNTVPKDVGPTPEDEPVPDPLRPMNVQEKGPHMKSEGLTGPGNMTFDHSPQQP